jgi:hypothetical protein
MHEMTAAESIDVHRRFGIPLRQTGIDRGQVLPELRHLFRSDHRSRTAHEARDVAEILARVSHRLWRGREREDQEQGAIRPRECGVAWREAHACITLQRRGLNMGA